MPIRIAIGPRDLKNKTAEIVRRDTLEKDTIALENISNCITIEGGRHEMIILKAKWFNKNLIPLIEKGKLPSSKVSSKMLFWNVSFFHLIFHQFNLILKKSVFV